MRIGVMGGGAWGTALAQVASAGGETTLWAREPEVVAAINKTHANPAFLPGIDLSPAIRATAEPDDLSACDAILIVTPAQHVRATLKSLPQCSVPLILCAKGIEAGTQKLVGEIAAEVQPGAPLAVLSGPTFAAEVARGLPTAITFACADAALAETLMTRLAAPTFRPYWTDDVIGAEVGGAVKNVLAIACGIVAGRDLGENAKAALISRGFAEMVRFGLAKGARAETLGGLSGLGDLVLTCASTQSRNMSLGMGLGAGKSAAALLSDRLTVAEGAHSAPVLQSAATALGVEMPISAAVSALLGGDVDVETMIERLLARPRRAEIAHG